MDTVAQAQRTDLVYRHERPLFLISIVFALLAWLALIVGTLGIGLLYVLLAILFYLFVQSAFISYLRGTGVLITAEQFPDLYARVIDCCRMLGVNPPPDAYLIHADGAFNALATRFLGRNFIVLFSNVVDALEDDPQAINFYIGHELGHIQRKHLQWLPILWPAGLLPLLGAAYSRAREYTCDAYGLACSGSVQSAAHGIAALAAGGERWKSMNLDRYGAQADQSGKFWMSFHELTGDYPWLTKRLARIRTGDGYLPPGRHFLAWLLAMFVPRFGIGGAGSVIVTVAVIGILAAVAVPAYQDYTARARITEDMAHLHGVQTCFAEFYAREGGVPENFAQCGINDSRSLAGPGVADVALGEDGVITLTFADESLPADAMDSTLVLRPYLDDAGTFSWSCAEGTLPPKYRPAACRE